MDCREVKEGNVAGFVVIPMFQETVCTSLSSSVPRLSLFEVWWSN